MNQFKMPWIAAAVAIVAAIAGFYNMNDVQDKLRVARSELSTANDRLDKSGQQLHEAADSLEYNQNVEKVVKIMAEALQKSFGKSSDTYYSEDKVVLLKVGGEPEQFTVHFTQKGKGNAQANMLSKDKSVDAKFKTRLSQDVVGKWISDEFKGGVATYQVTPGNTCGYNLIHFSNSVNNEAFDVLVLVI